MHRQRNGNGTQMERKWNADVKLYNLFSENEAPISLHLTIERGCHFRDVTSKCLPDASSAFSSPNASKWIPNTIDLETLPQRMLIISNYLPITVYRVEDQNNYFRNITGFHNNL